MSWCEAKEEEEGLATRLLFGLSPSCFWTGDRRLMTCLHQDRPHAARPSLSFLFLLSSSSGSGGGGRGRRRRRRGGGGGERPGVGRSLWLGQRCMLVFLHPPYRAVRRGWRSRRDSSEGVHERERESVCVRVLQNLLLSLSRPVL